MKVTPKTEKEIAEANLLQPGIYDAEVVKAEDTTSKAGNDMIALTLRVYADSAAVLVNDYLLDAIAYKVRHAADAMKLLPDYEAGTLRADDMVGKSVRVKIAIQKDKAGQYPDRNGVADYITAAPVVTAPRPGNGAKYVPPGPGGGIIDDEIPFGPCWQ